MKKLLFVCVIAIIVMFSTGCGCGKVQDPEEKYYKEELYFSLDSMDTMNVDIKNAIKEGILEVRPLKMRDGSFHVENNNFFKNSEEGTTKTNVKFEKFLINAVPKEEEINAELFFIGTITTDFESNVETGGSTIKNKTNKVMSFTIEGKGTSVFNEKAHRLKIVIPELVQTGTVNQTTIEIVNGEESSPIPRTWEINETFNNYQMTFGPNNE